MTTVNSANSAINSYEKNTATVAKPQEKIESNDQPKALSTGDKLQTYTVKKGDTLWGISKEKIGNPQKWNNIFEINKDQIKDPNKIYPKQVLRLPIAVQEPDVKPQPKPVDEKPVQNDPQVIDNPKPTPQKPDAPSVTPGPVVNPPAVKKNNHLVLKSAAVGATVTAGTLVGVTAALAAPLSNLGGYATAQLVAKNLGKIGVKLGSAPEVASLVKSVGGPKVAGTIAVVGVGIAVAGLAAGGAYLYSKHSK